MFTNIIILTGKSLLLYIIILLNIVGYARIIFLPKQY